MDRPLPTDPPDEPVNRIKQFLEEQGAEESDFQSHHTSLSVFIPHGIPPEELRERWQKELEELSAKYEKNPNDVELGARTALLHIQLGDWTKGLSYLKRLHQLDPLLMPESLVMELIRMHLKKEPPAE